MNLISIRRTLILATVVVVAAMAAFTVQTVWAAGTNSTTKAAKKAKTVAINIIVKAEKDAEVELIVEKKNKKKKNTTIGKLVNLKKGMNYFTYNKGKKGNYTVSLIAYGETFKQHVTAVQGSYTVFYNVAPPKDGEDKDKKTIEYQDITKLK